MDIFGAVLWEFSSHNQALRLVLKSIAIRHHGKYLQVAKIGRAVSDKRHGGQCQKKIIMLLPDSRLERADIDPANMYRSRLKPDIMLMEMTQLESMSEWRPSQGHLEVATTRSSQSRADGSSGP